MLNKMKPKFFVVYILIFTFFFQACKFPKDEIEKFEINVNTSFINILLKVKISTEDSMPVKNVTFNINGEGAKDIFDMEGKTNFNADGGKLDLILGPNANPTNNNPTSFTIQSEMEGYLPIKQDVFIFNKVQKVTVNLVFKRPVNLPTGLNYKSISLAFLGKRAIDTAYFNVLRSDGINFSIKYPTKGLVFIRKTTCKFRTEDNSIALSSLLQDTTDFVNDSNLNDIPNLNSKVFRYNKNRNEANVNCNPLTLVSKNKNVTTRIGFKKPELTATYDTRIIPDTFALGNVRVNVITQTNFQEYGYINENGNLVENYTSFNNAVGIPQVFFYDQVTGVSLIPYYFDGSNGAIIEAELPLNSYKLFMEGIDYSTKLKTYYQTKRTVELKPKFFETEGTNYKIRFRDDFLNGRYFLYNNAVNSCGFASVKFTAPNIPLNAGFSGKLNVSNAKYNVTYDIDYNKPMNEFRVPAFLFENTSLNVNLDHSVNICRNNKPLYDDELLKTELCNYTNTDLNLVLNYNPSVFLATINANNAITAKAAIVCPSGNYVLPPTTDLYLYQLGCNSESTIRFENGEYFSPSLIEDKKTYIIRYEKPNSTGAPTKIYDTLYFDSSVPEIAIGDDKTGYWNGTLKYTNQGGFDLNVIFDNKKLKFNIPNCK